MFAPGLRRSPRARSRWSWSVLRRKTTERRACGREGPSLRFPVPQMAEPRLYSAEDFRRRVAERLSFDGSAVGDHTFSPGIADAFLEIERRQAAVLVPVIHRE